MNSFKFAKHLVTRLFLVVVFLLPLVVGFTTPVRADDDDDDDDHRGTNHAVYTITNAADGNEVIVFQRASDGSLSMQESVSTGGLGSGTGLGSQEAVVLTENGRRLFVVNAGSNQISVFAVRNRGLKLLDVTDSGGIMPISLTLHGRILYVLNAGGSGNISGFRVRDNGRLVPLEGSTHYPATQ